MVAYILLVNLAGLCSDDWDVSCKDLKRKNNQAVYRREYFIAFSFWNGLVYCFRWIRYLFSKCRIEYLTSDGKFRFGNGYVLLFNEFSIPIDHQWIIYIYNLYFVCHIGRFHDIDHFIFNDAVQWWRAPWED